MSTQTTEINETAETPIESDGPMDDVATQSVDVQPVDGDSPAIQPLDDTQSADTQSADEACLETQIVEQAEPNATLDEAIVESAAAPSPKEPSDVRPVDETCQATQPADPQPVDGDSPTTYPAAQTVGESPVSHPAEEAAPTLETVENSDAESECQPAPAASESQIPEAEVAQEAEKAQANGKATSAFAALGLSDGLLTAVERSGYTTPTPIQAKTIPLVLSGQDVLGQAQTGTGKTAAFALPLLDRINLRKKKTQVLVLTPTRELAIQVAESFEKYAHDMRGFRVAPIYGGQDYEVQFRRLSRGVHVIVGTPGRVMDHMRRGSLDLSELSCLVLDEADEMLRMGFAEDVDWILTQAPEERQMALFSATMPDPIRKIAQTHLKDPAEVTIRQRTATADTVHQRYIVISNEQKKAALARILEAEETDGVLVFVKMKGTTEPLADYLNQTGLNAAALNGDMAQRQREWIVDRLRSGKIDIIVATDVAARGLDVQRISHVINYDLPHDNEAYVHRIGRTGRAGRSGEAILFMHPREQHLLRRLERATRQTIEPMNLPSNRAINKNRVARFHEKMTECLGHPELEVYKSIVEQYQRENDVPLELIAASLAALANEETPLLTRDEVVQAAFEDRYASRGRKKAYGKRDGRRDFDDSRPRQRDFRRDRDSKPRRSDASMETFRIEVGRDHQVQPGNIVGAIANETDLGSEAIGRIKIFDRFSTVDLPQDIPQELLVSLQDVQIVGRKLRISRMGEGRRPSDRRRSERRHDEKRPFKKSFNKSFNKAKSKPKRGKKKSPKA